MAVLARTPKRINKEEWVRAYLYVRYRYENLNQVGGAVSKSALRMLTLGVQNLENTRLAYKAWQNRSTPASKDSGKPDQN